MLKRSLYLFILGFALVGLLGQTASDAAASAPLQTGVENQADMLCCPQLQKQQKTGNGDQTEGCCSSDCAAMLYGSQSNATFDHSASLPRHYFTKAVRLLAAVQFVPPGQTHMPIIRPPIAS